MTPPRQRSDAAAHRTLLLDAAEAVFTEHGVNVALAQVVDHAGVGRATLYRNFPDRPALMAALFERSLARMAERALAVQEHDDGLFMLLDFIGELIAASAPIADYWRAMDRQHPIIAAAQKRLAQIFAPSLQHALATGRCRPDLTLADLSLIVNMLGASRRGATEALRRKASRRMLELLIEGLRAPEPTTR